MANLEDIVSKIDRTGEGGLGGITASVENIITLALDFAGVVAVIMILYSAVLLMTAYGEESKAESAKKTLLWTIVGLAVMILAKVIISVIITSFGEVK